MKSVKVLVVDDSELFAHALAARLRREAGIDVVGVARDGRSAVERTAALRPDVVTMDVHMPVMDGLLAVERIMAQTPTPILVLTEDPLGPAGDRTFGALQRGALDVVRKPGPLPWEGEAFAEVVTRIRLLARVPVIRHVGGTRHRWQRRPPPARSAAAQVVGVVASTGGPRAISQILCALPANFPLPIVVVQHLAPGFTTALCDWLDRAAPLSVVEATEGATLQRGAVYVAPADRHLEVDARGVVVLREDAPEAGHRPSGSVLLRSLARSYGRGAIGVILTGMGRDGVDGLAALARVQAPTVVQDAATSVVDGMPRAAREAGLARVVVPLPQIAGVLCELAGVDS